MSPLVKSLLDKRGITSESDIQAFLNPDYDLHTHSPFLLEGMDMAVERVLSAIKNNERIAVYADFDCDGIPGAAVLSDFFEKIEYKNVEIYIPHRDREGYGFHEEAIKILADRGVKLIITVDVGTNAASAVKYAKGLDVDVIVTDHHEISIGHELPPAFAVLNPKLGEYPFREICGAAMAYKLVQALIDQGVELEMEKFVAIPEGWEKWLLDLVAIATIADMVPLVGENRVLALYGLKVLRKSQRPGIVALCEKTRLRQHAITEDDIGFSIAPRINAASRMDEPETAFRLLTTRNKMEAEICAAQLEKLNASRKGVVSGIVRKAKKNVSTRFTSEDRVVVVGDPEWKPALLGLAANSIMNERGGVVCVWGRDGNGKIKGSCRSDGSISLMELFSAAGDIFEEAGGHDKSGGFSVSHERVHSLEDALKEVVSKLEFKKGQEARPAEVRVTLPEVSSQLFSDVSRLAPFGIGNPKPVFLVSNTSVSSVKRFGKEQNHVEVSLSCVTSGTIARAYDFFRSPENFTYVPTVGATTNVLATIERDTFRGGLALRIVDVLAA